MKVDIVAAPTTPMGAPPEMVAELDVLHRLRRAVRGEFDILKEIGRGGMGVVFLARDIALDRLVAIKVLPTGGKPDAVERFRREARTAASLSHPNIVPVHAVREDEDLIFFVMKYVEGRALDGLLKLTGPLPVPMALSIAQQVGSALHHAHRNGVIHRDIKPANIMIDADGWALVADFGIAKVRSDHHLTRTGVTMGTPTYMSPEQCSGSEVTEASDQYSLGIMIYQMLTGREPFSGDSIAAVVTKHLFEDATPLTTLNPDCPPVVASAVHRMMAKAASDRWPSIRDAVAEFGNLPTHGQSDVRTDLIELVRSADIEKTPAREATGPRSRRRGAWWGWAIAFATVAGVAATVSLNPLSLKQDATPEQRLTLGGQVSSVLPALDRVDSVLTAETNESHAETPDSEPPPVQSSREHARPSIQTDRDSTPPQSRSTNVARENTAHVQPPAALIAPDPVPTRGEVRLGTRGLKAVLYVNGELYGAIGSLLAIEAPAGPTRFSIRIEGCTPWDSTITVPAGDVARIGYREPTCSGGNNP
jgi:serine/threonine protein kinase